MILDFSGWSIVTLLIYALGDYLYQRFGRKAFLNPVLTGILAVVTLLSLAGVSYDTYFKGAYIIHYLLGPATVALAIPIYRNWTLLKENSVPIFMTVILGTCFSITVTLILAKLFGVHEKILLSFLPRSATTPIAMAVSEITGGISAISAIVSIFSGLIGAVFGGLSSRLIKINDERIIGFALGFSSHGVGTAAAIAIGDKAAAFSALAMGLTGISTALIVPLFVSFFL